MIGNRRFRLLPESYILLAINILDLMITVMLLGTRNAAEGNPIMSFYLIRDGWMSVIMLKLGITVAVIFIAEWAKAYKPVFVRSMLRFAIIVYIGMYLLAFSMKEAQGLSALIPALL